MLGREAGCWEENQDAVKSSRELGGGLRCRDEDWGDGKRTGAMGKETECWKKD